MSCEVKGLTEHSTVKVSAMRESVDDSIRSVEGLREFIHRRLCEKENLLAEQFRMSEMQLMKRGRCCGSQFLLQGPRSVRLGAIWAADNNEVYLYDTQGVRYHKIRLKYCLRIEEIQGEDDVLERPAA